MKSDIVVLFLSCFIPSHLEAYSTIQTSSPKYSSMPPEMTPTVEYYKEKDYARTSQSTDHSSRSNLLTLKPKEVTNVGDLSNTGRVMVRAMSGAGVAASGPGGSRGTGLTGITINMNNSLSVG